MSRISNDSSASSISPLAIALAIQLFLTLLMPSFDFHGRHVFLGDLWSMIWPVVYLLRAKRSGHWKAALGFAAVFSIVYLHGSVRPVVTELLRQVDPFLNEPDTFEKGHEAVIALRFYLWTISAYFVFRHPWTSKCLQFLQKSALISLSLGSISIFAAKISPSILEALGRIYGYSPHASGWEGRMFGVFTSPNEAGVTLGLLILILSCTSVSLISAERISQVFAVLAVALTQSLSTWMAWVGVGLAYCLGRVKNIKNSLIFLLAAGSIFALIVALSPSFIFAHKLANFLYRFGPWRVYLQLAFERIDVFLLGVGFIRNHVDNAYIFLFNRGGILLLASILVPALSAVRRSWKNWTWPQRSLVIYLAVSSLTLDTIILRPVVAVILACALPLLSCPQIGSKTESSF